MSSETFDTPSTFMVDFNRLGRSRQYANMSQSNVFEITDITNHFLKKS